MDMGAQIATSRSASVLPASRAPWPTKPSPARRMSGSTLAYMMTPSPTRPAAASMARARACGIDGNVARALEPGQPRVGAPLEPDRLALGEAP